MASKNTNQPNILLINCDDLGYGDLGCYGSELNRTPTLDRLAEKGIRFTDFYMASSVCSPSRGAMMLGCYPPRISFGDFDGRWVLFPGQDLGLNPEETSMARILKQAGYATKIVGKWHCGDQKEFLPTRHGFDSYYGIPYSNDMGRQPRKNMDIYPPLPLLRNEEVIQEQPDQSALIERYLEESIRFIRDNREQPFFLYLAHMYVHLPIYPPARFLRESQNGRYGGAVECVDWSTCVLMDELEKLGLDGNTLVIFTSDNGSRARGEGGSNGNLCGTKGTTWEGGQRVPCIMHWPDRIPAGTVCRELATAMDFLPTFAELAGGSVPDDRIIDGRSIVPLMTDEKAESPHERFFYYIRNELQAVRQGKWKLHVHKGKEAINKLYDLENDPGETNNLYDDHPEVVKELSQSLDECREDIGDALTGVKGKNVRPAGRVDNPDTLTHYHPDHPYMLAEYDLREGG